MNRAAIIPVLSFGLPLVHARAQTLGVHLGVRHLREGEDYTSETFGQAVAALRNVDEEWKGNHDELEQRCPEAWQEILRWR